MSNCDIHEIELNFSNVCTANCIICSRPHGVGNSLFMGRDVFDMVVKQLKDVNFDRIQTSGNGEAFLNPNYVDYIRELRSTFNKEMWTYNNFSMVDKEKADIIVNENLFDKIHVRIDSLEKWVFERSSNLNQDLVFDNFKYFLSINKSIPVIILYNNIRDYYNACNEIIGKRPTRDYYTDDELDLVPKNEEQDILNYFSEYSSAPIGIFRIGHSLWGERRNAEPNPNYKCPRYKIISRITWICPNGDVSVCCYSKDTEVFTNSGWKLFKDLTGNELVLTRKSNGDTEWSHIEAIQKYNVTDSLYEIKNNSIDLAVTKDHKFPLLPTTDYSSPLSRKPISFNNGYIWVKAENLKSGNYLIPKLFNWVGTNVSKEYTHNFLKLLGWYLSEGCCYINNNIKNIVIYQNPDKKEFDDIKKIIIDNNFKPIRDSRSWRIHDDKLYDMFSKFGKSYDKYIPIEVKNLPKEYLYTLLIELIKGDGAEYKTGYRYYTVSKQLADDVQEIAYKCGLAANIRIQEPRANKFNGNRGLTQYWVYIQKNPNIGIGVSNLISKNKINKVSYNDFVYDITVEKNHTLWVRRNGKCVWSSNCYDDTQSKFIAGNIMEEHMCDIYNGSKRADLLQKIKSREYKDYPCTNPICCAFPDERCLCE